MVINVPVSAWWSVTGEPAFLTRQRSRRSSWQSEWNELRRMKLPANLADVFHVPHSPCQIFIVSPFPSLFHSSFNSHKYIGGLKKNQTGSHRETCAALQSPCCLYLFLIKLIKKCTSATDVLFLCTSFSLHGWADTCVNAPAVEERGAGQWAHAGGCHGVCLSYLGFITFERVIAVL